MKFLLAVVTALLCAASAQAETVYISDEEQNVVHVVDPARKTVIARIAVGQRPRGIGLSIDGRLLYVAVSNDNRIDIVDLKTRKVAGHLPSGPDPELFTISPDGRRLYVANEDDNLVSFVDVGAKRIMAEVPVGIEPEGMAVSPDGRLVVNTSEATSMVHFISASTGKLVDNLLVDTRPRYAAFTPDGKHLWVTSEVRGTLSIIDVATRKKIAVVDFENAGLPAEIVQPVGVAMTRDGNRAFVALGRGKLVAEVDPKSYKIVRIFPIGFRAWNLALSPDETRIYTANGLSGDMSIVDLTSNRPAGTIKLGGTPWGIVVAP